LQIRDWLYVGDHCAAIRTALQAGIPGETYIVGGWNEKTNLEVAHTLCTLLDELRPAQSGRPYRDQITYVTDRPGHDRRYAIDASRVARELGWKPRESFQSGIRRTVTWYLDNETWITNVTSGAYRGWIDLQYGNMASAPQPALRPGVAPE
jgi:dTDP-glucose 4,6-dehydratase